MQDQHFNSFEELFDKVLRSYERKPSKNKSKYSPIAIDNLPNTRNIHLYKFTKFCMEYKSWNGGQNDHWKSLLTLKVWNEYRAQQYVDYKKLIAEDEGEGIIRFEDGEDIIIPLNTQPNGERIAATETPTNREPVYKTLDDLFKTEYRDKIPQFIQLLRETEKPCIDEGYGYNIQYNNKGVVVVWFNALEAKEIVYKIKDRKEKARLLNAMFDGLNISGSLFTAENKTATENNKKCFEDDISAIKTQK